MERYRLRLSQWLPLLQSWLYPGCCMLCGSASPAHRDLCEYCHLQLPFNHTACPQCANPLPIAQLCPSCDQQPPPFAASQVPFRYEFPISTLLKRLKFQHQLAVARLIGELMAEHLSHAPIVRPDCIIPIPLHPSRLRQRGFNQSLELAKILSKTLNIPIDCHSCQRIVPTVSQTELTAQQRGLNVQQAFRLRRMVSYSRVAIVDDIMTTGHTVGALSQCLTAAGVEHVQIWAAARAYLATDH